MAYIAVASLGVGAASSIFSAIKSAKANKEKQRYIDKTSAENKAEFDNNANKDFLQTNVAKDAVKQQTEALEDDRKAVAGRAAITGASDEAKLAGNTSSYKTYQDGLSRLAGMGTNYQNQQKAIYLGQKAQTDQQNLNMIDDKAESAAALASNAGDMAAGAASLYGMNGSKVASANHIGDPGTNRTGNFDPMKPKTPKLPFQLDNKLK
jgi:hypothetical protein